MSLLKTEQPGYFKDSISGAILNTNDHEYHAILKSRDEAKKGKALCLEINNLKDELKEIKDMLRKVVGELQ